jgi:hypothetical protein
MDQLSFVSDLIANSPAYTPDILRLNAALLVVAILAVLVPVALRRFIAFRHGHAGALRVR